MSCIIFSRPTDTKKLSKKAPPKRFEEKCSKRLKNFQIIKFFEEPESPAVKESNFIKRRSLFIHPGGGGGIFRLTSGGPNARKGEKRPAVLAVVAVSASWTDRDHTALAPHYPRGRPSTSGCARTRRPWGTSSGTTRCKASASSGPTTAKTSALCPVRRAPSSVVSPSFPCLPLCPETKTFFDIFFWFSANALHIFIEPKFLEKKECIIKCAMFFLHYLHFWDTNVRCMFFRVKRNTCNLSKACNIFA